MFLSQIFKIFFDFFCGNGKAKSFAKFFSNQKNGKEKLLEVIDNLMLKNGFYEFVLYARFFKF